MQVINRDEAKNLIEGGDVFVIEALPEQYHLQGHLPGAVQINTGEVDLKVSQLPKGKGKKILVYCANKACKNSTEVALKLQTMGYTNIYKYEDGKDDWKAAGLPLETVASK